jgi:hypothetical protein
MQFPVYASTLGFIAGAVCFARLLISDHHPFDSHSLYLDDLGR